MRRTEAPTCLGNPAPPRERLPILNMGWFIGIGIGIGIEIARIDDEVDSDSDSDSDFDALHEVAVDKLRIADNP